MSSSSAENKKRSHASGTASAEELMPENQNRNTTTEPQCLQEYKRSQISHSQIRANTLRSLNTHTQIYTVYRPIINLPDAFLKVLGIFFHSLIAFLDFSGDHRMNGNVTDTARVLP